MEKREPAVFDEDIESEPKKCVDMLRILVLPLPCPSQPGCFIIYFHRTTLEKTHLKFYLKNNIITNKKHVWKK